MVRSNDYGDWFSDLIQGNQSLACSLHLITVTFDSKMRAFGQPRTEFDQFHDLYNLVCREVVGRNYHRPWVRNFLPKAFVAMDVANSKYRLLDGPVVYPHIHSIWVIRNSQLAKFDEFVWSTTFRSRLSGQLHIDGFDVVFIGDLRNTNLDKLSSYCTKFLPQNAKKLFMGEDVRIYPLSKEYLALLG